ncbi:carbon-nitrogen hydrolase [Pseudoalteromonas sp. MSK9-3]|uniref:amidohydrolase n=1 Tax=Pseudoalteromonas sp. MSK9-3 TaxID=1897633 RepID=UPI000E6BE8B7|nr:amidohydrolase [Pseudoalteromonas sp. MSK9-3]RJE71286.1 carbon-nitrogen hydrolase [Pseudoalteromonas sp. MSK9-3]
MSTLTHNGSSQLCVALVQQDIAWLQPELNFTQLEMLLTKRLSDHAHPVDLILLPETFATGFAVDLAVAEAQPGPILQWLITTAQRFQAVIAGSVLVKQGAKQVNRFYWVRPDGTISYYDKRHLFRLGNEGEYVEAGQSRAIFTLGEFRFLPQVCYDLRFPVFQRNRNDYDVMVNVANWPAARRHVWDTLLMARAMENQCYVLACNRIGTDGKGVAHNGGTAVYDFKGEPLLQSPDDQACVEIVQLRKNTLDEFRAGFPAHLDADEFMLR